jgi:REP element-mobilizing transposase RayT
LDHPPPSGFAPFKNNNVALLLIDELRRLEQRSGWQVTAAVVMPNHIHFLAQSKTETETQSLREVIRNFKGRTARLANQTISRKGKFWQRDWFDRWMRDESEIARTTKYIRHNPVKAGLVKIPSNWPWQI